MTRSCPLEIDGVLLFKSTERHQGQRSISIAWRFSLMKNKGTVRLNIGGLFTRLVIAGILINSERTIKIKKYIDILMLFAFKQFFRFFWDLIMTVVYIISFISIPFSVCFIIMSHDDIGLDKFNLLIYGFCWIDIIMNCFTGYYDKYEMGVELRPLKIFM